MNDWTIIGEGSVVGMPMDTSKSDVTAQAVASATDDTVVMVQTSSSLTPDSPPMLPPTQAATSTICDDDRLKPWNNRGPEKGYGGASYRAFEDDRPSPYERLQLRSAQGKFFPLIAEWWTTSHDALLEPLIRVHQWFWHIGVSDKIQQITDPSVLAAWRVEHEKTPQNIWFNAIMYHARYRATELGLTKLIRIPEKKPCQLCGHVFVENSLHHSLARRLGMDRLDFCAPCLAPVWAGAGRADATRDEILDYLRTSATTLQRIPSQGFEEGDDILHALSDDERPVFLRMITGRPSARAVKKEFGTWFDALCEAGLLENGARRLIIGTQCRAIDGHLCTSLGEKTIDDFLHSHAIAHDREPHYPEGNYRADFRIGEALVEYFGLAGNPEYDETIKLKRAIARRHAVKLIEIHPKDLASIKSLEKKLLGAVLKVASSATNPE